MTLPRTPAALALAPAGLAAAALLLAACTGGAEAPEGEPATGRVDDGQVADAAGVGVSDAVDLDVALSEPVRDPVYPEVGQPGVDALHYGLDLGWSPDSRTLDAVQTLVFRATRDADEFRLDFGAALEATSVAVDGEVASFEEVGDELVIASSVTADERYTVEIEYGGTPQPVAAPTTRSDFSRLGWTITDDGETWTMQEPYGAHSWYAVNDHPSDKALYDFRMRVPAPWSGVANGELTSREVVDGTTVTEWHLDEPAAAYLVTAAFGDFRMSRAESASGVPVTYWTPRGDARALRAVRAAHRELGWVEQRLGAYPFSTLGVLVVDSRSGMETQTMITLGNTDYTLSPQVVVHELVHQWWGNQVGPTDWYDMWLNEGMAMYLQAVWEADRGYRPLEDTLRWWAAADQAARDEAGPPAAYDPTAFGQGNVYQLPALMWHEVRDRIGDELFWELVREWPRADDDGHVSYEEAVSWWSEQSGEDLAPLFEAWLLGETSPPFTP
ncbi:M1 family metallopeptidase [Nocardioides sp. GCM10027113]|uniref:M1 family metallopeptidase n=1 Tax=unclassified Nocardioides TaxID=2615069 RepID=UPI003614C370